MKTTILLLFISVSCLAQQGAAKSYADLSSDDRLQRAIDSLDNINRVNTEFLLQVKRDATIRTLKTKAYTALNNITVGATLTAAQLQAAAWVSLWNTGAINPATNKIDSTLNFIK